MKKSAMILTLFLLVLHSAFGQSDQLKAIDQMALKIDSNPGLLLNQFDAAEVFGHEFDGGGTVTIYTAQNEIKKIEQVIGLSYGRVTTAIYIDEGKPIKIIDREENYPVLANQTGLDYSQLNKVFEANIYVFAWDRDNTKTIMSGERNLSEGTCGLFEYEPMVDMAARLIEK